MQHTLPELPYSFDALEPYIDAKTMEIHHGKHHQAYVDKLNEALKEAPGWDQKPLGEVLQFINKLPDAIQTKVRNNGGGHWNHSFFWPLMKKEGEGKPFGALAEAIDAKFESFEKFKTEFTETAKNRFGSGWAWLIINKSGELEVMSTPNQDSPVMDGHKPVLGLDVWEHAYYLRYGPKRPDYVEAWWNVVNWQQAEENYKKAKAGTKI